MARIKAKPIMNRLPIAPYPGVKSGIRSTPPPLVYDPTAGAYAAAPRQFIYPSNGTTATALPANVAPTAFGPQVHMFPFQQPYYMAWPTTATQPPSAQNYYDLAVFPTNGLTQSLQFQAPAPTSKSQNPRYAGQRGSNVPRGGKRGDYRNSDSRSDTRSDHRNNGKFNNNNNYNKRYIMYVLLFLEHGSSSAHHQSHNHNRLSQSSYHTQYNQATSITATVVSTANTQSSVGSSGKYVGQNVIYSSGGGKSAIYHKDDTKSSSNVPHYSSNNNYHNHHQPSYDQESGYISKRASNYDNDESYAPSSSYRGKGLSASTQSNSDWSQRRRRRKDDEIGSGGVTSGGRGNSTSGNNTSHVNYGGSSGGGGGGHHNSNTTYSSHSTTSQQQHHHSQQQSHNAANKAPTSATPIVATTIQPTSPQPSNGVTSIPPLMRDIPNSNNQGGSISASISGGSTSGNNNNATSASVTATTVPATIPANGNISAASTINRAFDLEQSAFPPLPGLIKRDEKSSQATQTGNQTVTVGALSHATGPLTGYANTAGGISGVQGKGPQLPNVSGNTLDAGIPIVDVVPAVTSGAWGENRLADVVKGTAKTAATTTSSSATTTTTTTSPTNSNISKKSEPSRIESPPTPPQQQQQIPLTPATPQATINFDNANTSSSQAKTTPPSNLTTTPNTQSPITNDPATLSTVTMTPPFSPETTNATNSNNNHSSNSKTSPPVIKSSTSSSTTTIIASSVTAAVDKVTKTEAVMVNGMDAVNNTENTSASSVAPMTVDNKTMSMPQQKASKNTPKAAATAAPQTGFNATLSPSVSLPTPAASPTSPQTSHDPSAPAPKLSYAQVAHSFTAAAVKEENNNNNNMSNNNTTERERTISEKENSVGNRKKDLTSPPNSRVNSQQRGKFLIYN